MEGLSPNSLLEIRAVLLRDGSGSFNAKIAPDSDWNDVGSTLAAVICQIAWASVKSGNPSSPEELLEHILQITADRARSGLHKMDKVALKGTGIAEA